MGAAIISIAQIFHSALPYFWGPSSVIVLESKVSGAGPSLL